MCAPQSKFRKPVAASRLDALTQGSLTLESYKYLGLATIVEQDEGDGVNLTYISAGTSDSGDPYTGLDRFGRVIVQNWTRGGTASQDAYAYTYDRDGNVPATFKKAHRAAELEELGDAWLLA